MAKPRVPTVDSFFSTHHALRARFEQGARQMATDTRDRSSFEAWRSSTRAHLQQIIGIDTMRVVRPEPVKTESVRCDGYVRHRMEMHTESDVVMPFYVLTPDDLGPNERRPVVITPHGHASGGKNAPVGRTDIPAVTDAVARYNYAYGHRFAQAGLMVFAPDARAFGERREPVGQLDDEDSFMRSTCTPLNHAAIALGQSVTGMWAWDLMRLVDYIQTRDDCDPERIGCAGLSGGGLQTLWLVALDDRVRAAVVSGYFYGYRDSLLDLNGNCGCNYVPGLWQAVDMGDLGALAAPRPLFIETGLHDPLNGSRGLVNVTEQIAITREAYGVFNSDTCLVHAVCDGEHQWFGETSEPWMIDRLIEN